MNFIDIGVNLTDDMYNGVYHGKKLHEPDLDLVLKRAAEASVNHLIVTGTSYSDIKEAIEMIKNKEQQQQEVKLSLTIGIHPTRCNEFKKDSQLMDKLSRLIEENRDMVVAVGECGLDYDRTKFCAIETQLKGFEAQFVLSKKFNLPLFLHNRGSGEDFYQILERHVDDFNCAVVHTYDDTWELAEKLIKLKPNGMFFGLNGCSMKKEENLRVIEKLPMESILLETDAPWCDIRPTHASYKYLSQESLNKIKNNQKKKERFQSGFQVKSRNEPCNISFVLDVLSGLKKLPREQVAHQVYQNTLRWLKNC